MYSSREDGNEGENYGYVARNMEERDESQVAQTTNPGNNTLSTKKARTNDLSSSPSIDWSWMFWDLPRENR